MLSVGVSNCNDLRPQWEEIVQWCRQSAMLSLCDKFDRPLWVELLPAEGSDSDAFDEGQLQEFS